MEFNDINEVSAILGISSVDIKPLKQIRKEIKLLKSLWDYIDIIKSNIDNWKKTPWTKIDIELMEFETKMFAKELKSFDKDIRQCDAFIGAENLVKNIISSLKSVSELRNPAIRWRHWNELMQTTGVNLALGEQTKLEDLLALNLHQFEEEVVLYQLISTDNFLKLLIQG